MNRQKQNKLPEMKALVANGSFKIKMNGLFKDYENTIFKNDTKYISSLRFKSLEKFNQLDFPTRKTEDWRHTDLGPALSKDYYHYSGQDTEELDLKEIFTCNVHDLETDQISLLNGWHADTAEPLKKSPDGVISGSLSTAMREYPELFNDHFGKYAEYDKNIFLALNTAFAVDGLFIYVPDNVIIEKPIQMISIVHPSENLMLHNRNLVIMGRNSRLTLVQCDDSTNHQASFNNSVTEVIIGQDSVLDHYKLQNLNDESTLLNCTYFHQEQGSRLSSNAISLNGGLIRNYTNVILNGPHAEANIYGLYLMDKKQHIDNQVYVQHASPDCQSSELFKGIMDDEASAVFNGHVLVDRDAQRTSAFQENRNILLTDKAQVNTNPFLELYADDVKCSHGATVGQLDAEALFYIRSRGLCEASARLLMMYAFTAEVINKISIEALKGRIDDMVKKRLRGELSICERCVLHCSHPEKEIAFDIDLSQI